MNFTNESPMAFNCVMPEFVSLFFVADACITFAHMCICLFEHRISLVGSTFLMFLFVFRYLFIKIGERTKVIHYIEMHLYT